MSLLRNRFIRIGLLTLVMLFIAYTALGFWLVPRMVRGNLQDLAREQYQRELQVGKITFNPFTLVLELRKQKGQELPYEAANVELTKALLASQPASEAELGDLARARAEAIRVALLGSGEIDAKRVFVLGIKAVPAVGGKVRAELALK